MFSSVIVLANTSIGAGVLTLPYAVKQCGLAVGVVMMLGMAVMACGWADGQPGDAAATAADGGSRGRRAVIMFFCSPPN